MNRDELRDYLINNKVSEEDANVLYAQQIDESTISSITKDVLLYDLKLLLGPSLLILKIFESLQHKNNQYIVEYLDESLPEEFLAVGQSVSPQNYDPSTDLSEVLRSNCGQTSELIPTLQRGESLDMKQMRILVRVTVDNLLKQSGNYPKTSCKMALAQNIVKTWPQLGQKTFPNKPPHFFLFNTDSSTISGRSKNGGLIENRVDNTMRKLPQDQRRYIKRKKTEQEVFVDQVEPITNGNRTTIEDRLRSSVEVRNKLRKAGATARQILENFPVLLDFEGDMIDVEFSIMNQHERTDITDTTFVGLLPYIIAASNIHIEVPDEYVKGILCLLASLPKPRTKKAVIPANDLIGWLSSEIIQWIHVEDDLESSVEKNSQPFIVCVTETPSAQGRGTYYVIIDRKPVKVGEDFLRAMEVLYKVFHVFNLAYPVKLKNFYSFFESYVFKFANAKPTISLDNFMKKLK